MNKTASILILIIGIATALFGLLMDTTVESGSSRVHNIGLMHERLILTILGSVIFGAGLISLAIIKQKTNEKPIKKSNKPTFLEKLLTEKNIEDPSDFEWEKPNATNSQSLEESLKLEKPKMIRALIIYLLFLCMIAIYTKY